LPEKASILKAFELVDKQELVQEDVTDVGREQADVLNQVVMQLTRILTAQAFEGETTGIVDANVVPGRLKEDHVTGLLVYPLEESFLCLQDFSLGLFQDAVQTPEYNKRQYHLAILRLLEVTAQDLRDGPDKRTEVADLFSCHVSSLNDPSFLTCTPGGQPSPVIFAIYTEFTCLHRRLQQRHQEWRGLGYGS